MKKYLFFLLTLVVASFAFISCSSDDDSDNGTYDKSQIVGTWDMTEVKLSQTGTYMDWPYRKTYASFKADGSYYGSGYFGTGSGTWSIKGNKLNTYVDGELYATYEILSANSTTAEMKMTLGDDSIWIKCKKN